MSALVAAMRAAFKAVESGYQVAVLVPTTVLAEQHYKTFQKRMAEFPFEIAKLSRFETSAEQKETVRRLAHGQVDIVIGTHRLASADVQFSIVHPDGLRLTAVACHHFDIHFATPDPTLIERLSALTPPTLTAETLALTEFTSLFSS